MRSCKLLKKYWRSKYAALSVSSQCYYNQEKDSEISERNTKDQRDWTLTRNNIHEDVRVQIHRTTEGGEREHKTETCLQNCKKLRQSNMRFSLEKAKHASARCPSAYREYHVISSHTPNCTHHRGNNQFTHRKKII